MPRLNTPALTCPVRIRPARFGPALASLLALLLAAAAGPALASPERARDALARGDLRAAQIEWRNAVRNRPDDGALRVALAAASLEIGDADTAEKEARAALERGHDPAAATALLLRSYLARGRFQELLRDFPINATAPAAVAGQVAAGRAMAQLGLRETEEARRSAAEALRLAPGAIEPHLVAAMLAVADGDRAAALRALDQALALDPRQPEALLRRASLLLAQGDRAAALASLDRLIEASPGSGAGRVLRAELRIQAANDAGAKEDVDAALRSAPGNAPATYLRAVLLARGQDWRGADEVLSRLGPVLGSFPEGYLFLAQVKRQLNQTAQAEDAAQRHVARRPEDPRGVKLLAALQQLGDRPGEAVATLTRFTERADADAEAYDLLGRAAVAAGQLRAAAAAFEAAAKRAPQDADIASRLAAARLTLGDAQGTRAAAEEAIRLGATRPELLQMLGFAALARGDLPGVTEALGRLAPEARQGEAATVLDGTLKLLRRDVAGARAAFQAGLAANPQSVSARLGLVRVAAIEGDEAAMEGLLGEILQLQPANTEAISGLGTLAAGSGPQAAAAEARLAAAQAASPAEPALAIGLAALHVRKGNPTRAAALLEAEPLKAQRGVALPFARAEAHAAAEQWPAAAAASRAALAEDPNAAVVRRQLALILNRAGDATGAELLLREGLLSQPANPLLQGTLVGLIQQGKGLEAALAEADRLAARQDARPASLTLRGDLLMGVQRHEDAARAYAAAQAQAPSSLLVQREAAAWRAARKPAEAAAVLNQWLTREPNDAAVVGLLAQIDIQNGRLAQAEQRLSRIVDRVPNDAATLNNLAWVLAEVGQGTVSPRARELAERAFFLSPGAETADTLGWILVRGGDAASGLPLLRRAASVQRAGNRGPDPGMAFRYAVALRATGDRSEAIRVLEQSVGGDAAFPERDQALRLLAELKAGR
jgi:putative PEP-CTERM system TPR-repeat lipoprotein